MKKEKYVYCSVCGGVLSNVRAKPKSIVWCEEYGQCFLPTFDRIDHLESSHYFQKNKPIVRHDEWLRKGEVLKFNPRKGKLLDFGIFGIYFRTFKEFKERNKLMNDIKDASNSD